MRNKYIHMFEHQQIKDKKIPDFRAGDTLQAHISIKEGKKNRIQIFEGLCISLRGEGVGKTVMIRKIGANNIGVERIFPLYSDSIEKIEVLKRGKIRRAKLFYIRALKGKKARMKELRSKIN